MESMADPLYSKTKLLGRKSTVLTTSGFRSAWSMLEESVPMAISRSLTTEPRNTQSLPSCPIRQGPLRFSSALVRCRVLVAALSVPDLFMDCESNVLLQDTVRDVRGFAIKFYTEEGIWDLVGNNIPVFFIQDAIKFPDVIHAVKPEPHNEIPQGQSAHNNFWDFAGLQTESTFVYNNCSVTYVA